jgi:NADPH-dependent glutamate synthase beta subunit-like oxidoreductase
VTHLTPPSTPVGQAQASSAAAPARPPPPTARGREPSLLETSRPGVFAVGDARAGSVKRVASAVGEGSIVVSSVHQVLAEGQGATLPPLLAAGPGW